MNLAKKQNKTEQDIKEPENQPDIKAEEPSATPAEGEPVSVELETLKAELEKQKDLLLRTAAEFDNYKRRTERERITAGEYVKASTLKVLLPVFDSLDRAEGADPASAEYAKGIEMIVKQLSDAVEKLGLTEIDAAGAPFDPTLHEAVMHVEDDAAGENTVVEVLQKGYKVGDTVVRHAMVKVAN
ncbi:MAG: nucleotide exchange factor GrpE [Candidatus Howiella sp.]